MKFIPSVRSTFKPAEVTVGRFTIFPALGYVVLVANRLGLTPNAVTICSFMVAAVIGVLSALNLSDYRWLVAILLQVFIILDCADGSLARFTGMTSRFGALLDQVLDRFSDLVVVLGLAVGVHRAGGGPLVWIGAILFLFGILLNVLMGHVYNQLRSGSAETDAEASIAELSARGHLARRVQTVVFGGDVRFLLLSLAVLTDTTAWAMLGAGALWCLLLVLNLVMVRSKLSS